MDIPGASDPVWKEVITGTRTCKFEFLGLQMLAKRLNLQFSLNPAPEALEESTRELRQMFVKNANLPKVQRDLKKIFDKGALP
jgi:hypothetical protein